MSDILIPSVITLILLWGVFKKVDIAREFAEGAREGIMTLFEILPSLVLVMTAVGMFTRSGAVDMLSALLLPFTQTLGFPQECVSLAMIRPFSGSGALASVDKLLESVSPDSFPGRVASVIMGSTETTFYTISVYFAAIKKKAYPMVFAGACFADICGFVLSALAVRLYFD